MRSRLLPPSRNRPVKFVPEVALLDVHAATNEIYNVRQTVKSVSLFSACHVRELRTDRRAGRLQRDSRLGFERARTAAAARTKAARKERSNKTPLSMYSGDLKEIFYLWTPEEIGIQKFCLEKLRYMLQFAT